MTPETIGFTGSGGIGHDMARNVVEKSYPLTVAAKIVHIGHVGDEHRMKLLNTFLSPGYAAIYAEAIALPRKVDRPVATFDRAIRGGRLQQGYPPSVKTAPQRQDRAV